MRGKKGITLIALVAMVVILIILAAITMRMLTDENGLIKKASEASNKVDTTQRHENEVAGGVSGFLANHLDSNEVSYETPSVGNIYISKSPDDWTNGDINVDIAYPSINVSFKQYRIGETGAWINYAGSVKITQNCVIYARYSTTDGIYTGDTDKAYVIDKIDKLAPNVFSLSYKSTQNSITITGVTTDASTTALNGSSGIQKYQYKLDNGTWQDSNVFSGLVQGSIHTINMRAIDNAGNITEATNKDSNVILEK